VCSSLCLLAADVLAADIPRLEKKDGRFTLVVDGKPMFVLGAQINNSSSWASTLPQVWPALEAAHVNTMEAPVYWEQMEPEQGKFDFSTVDMLVNGAREHHLHLVLLWFGTWKNGQAHYVPEWIKTDTKKYPREVSRYGKVLDVLSPNSPTNLEADKAAFSALMRHVREIDGEQHTVIMMQVENETGSIGSVRDYSAAAEKEFGGDVPSALTKAMHLPGGRWSEVFGGDADERFAAYSTARYVNEVAKAGKSQYPLPMYCNVWITYPVHALENRNHPSPGQEYPSGGPQQGNIDLWKAAAPAIDILAPDFYSDDSQLFREVVAAYHRDDNALFIPETGLSKDIGHNLFYVLGQGAVGFSPFGVDYSGWNLAQEKVPQLLAEDFALLQPMAREVAEWNLAGKLQTAVEQRGMTRQRLHFGDVDAIVSFGYPQHDGEMPPGTSALSGRAIVAQLGPLEFVVTGFDASVSFESGLSPQDRARNEQLEILRAEEGQYVDSVWRMNRVWNGDQTDRGLKFNAAHACVIRIRMHRLPLYDETVRSLKR
jgi:beta-galactosidase GanA